MPAHEGMGSLVVGQFRVFDYLVSLFNLSLKLQSITERKVGQQPPRQLVLCQIPEARVSVINEKDASEYLGPITSHFDWLFGIIYFPSTDTLAMKPVLTNEIPYPEQCFYLFMVM